MRISETIALAALAGTIVLAAPSKADGRGSRCEPSVNGEIDRLQVDPATVGATSYQVRTHVNRRDQTRTDRILAWVDLESCTGKLVIELSPRCRVKQAYTTGACTVPGLSNY